MVLRCQVGTKYHFSVGITDTLFCTASGDCFGEEVVTGPPRLCLPGVLRDAEGDALTSLQDAVVSLAARPLADGGKGFSRLDALTFVSLSWGDTAELK